MADAHAGWEWETCGSRFTISEDGLVATMGAQLANPHEPDDEEYNEGFETEPCQVVTCGQPMTQGRHYWEVEYTTSGGTYVALFGAVRPGQDCEKTAAVEASNTARFMVMSDPRDNTVCLFGNGKSWNAAELGCDGDDSHIDEGKECVFKQGDRIGMLLDLDAGWLRFYRNDKRLRQEFASGVTGPLLRCADLCREGDVVTALPGAEMPADADL
jgi:hypothetical protein